MSLTSYRAAPPRAKKQKPPLGRCRQRLLKNCEWVLDERWLQSLATTYSSTA
jgi:hypothetical protein